ncbi:cytochrome c oxidase assembly protein [Croceicoccus naphthovorans]|uniref:cytochrome c oxidase assembly protein n=1 Tax=Croceicoccus naphthovorans TaxID=1348774 RepID=UPI00184AAEAC|nr:putative membrane protein [Croceicoccus naphthovorans]
MLAWIPYCGAAPVPSALLERWNLDPVLLIAFGVAAVALQISRARVRRGSAISVLGLVGFLYISPFCALGSALFSVRVIHDLILAAVLAPLSVATFRLDKTRLGIGLPVITAIHALTFWLWHAPPAYAAAMSNDAVFWAMQLTIVGTATIWWARVLQAAAPAAVLSLLATMVAMGALGALLTFAPNAMYAPHWLTTQTWGWSPLDDQQMAGIIMWAPASAIYLLAALALLYRMFGDKAIHEAA